MHSLFFNMRTDIGLKIAEIILCTLMKATLLIIVLVSELSWIYKNSLDNNYFLINTLMTSYLCAGKKINQQFLQAKWELNQ